MIVPDHLPDILKVGNACEEIVCISPNGDVWVNPKFTVTEAAKAFWSALFGEVSHWTGWIPVKHPPEKHGTVLVWRDVASARERKGIATLYYHPQSGFWDESITHWMLAPKGPKR